MSNPMEAVELPNETQAAILWSERCTKAHTNRWLEKGEMNDNEREEIENWTRDAQAREMANEGETFANAGQLDRSETAFAQAEGTGRKGGGYADTARQRTQPVTDETRQALGEGEERPETARHTRRERLQTRKEDKTGNDADSGSGDRHMRQSIRDAAERATTPSENPLEGSSSRSAGVIGEYAMRNAGGQLKNAGMAEQMIAGLGLATRMKVAGTMDDAEGIQKSGTLEGTKSAGSKIAGTMMMGALMMASPKGLAAIVSGGLVVMGATGAITGGAGTAAAATTRFALRAGMRTVAKIALKSARVLRRAGPIGRFLARRLKGFGRYMSAFNKEMGTWDRIMTGGTYNALEAGIYAGVRGQGIAGVKRAIAGEYKKTAQQWTKSFVGKAVGRMRDVGKGTTSGSKIAGKTLGTTSRTASTTTQGTKNQVQGRMSEIRNLRRELGQTRDAIQKAHGAIQTNVRQTSRASRRFVAGRITNTTARTGIRVGYGATQAIATVGSAGLKMVGRATMAGLGGIHTGKPVRAASIGVISDEIIGARAKKRGPEMKAGHAIEKEGKQSGWKEAQATAANFKPEATHTPRTQQTDRRGKKKETNARER